MDSFDTIIVNGQVVTAADAWPYDIGIRNGKIACLAPSGSLAGSKAARVIDAQGGMVMVSTSWFARTLLLDIDL